MRFLLIDYFSNKSSHKFDEFENEFKKRFMKILQIYNVNHKIICIKRNSDLDQFCYRNKQNYSKILLKKLENFKLIDIVLIGRFNIVGDKNIYPWKKKNRRILELIKMCKENKKPILILGGAIYSLMYLCACDFKIMDIIKTGSNNLEKVFRMDLKTFFKKFFKDENSFSKK